MKLNWIAYTWNRFDGYGYHGLQMIRGLTQEGVEVTPMTVGQLDWPGWVRQLSGMEFSGRISIKLTSAGEFRPVPGRLWGYSMYESTQIPDGWAAKINATCERFIVPSPWLIDVFRAAGVSKGIPIDVIGEGIDPAQFPYIHRPARKIYTFLALGDRAPRKGDDIAWRAFYKAFGEQDDVRLLIKRRPDFKELNGTTIAYSAASSDPRRTILSMEADSMADVYALADCFVFPTRGEGWGLPAREAAATGMPVIATNWSGTAVDIDKYAIPIENYKLMPARGGLTGNWAEPDVEEVAAHMRWCYENREEAAAKGKAASEWLHANQTWRHAARDLMALVERYGYA